MCLFLLKYSFIYLLHGAVPGLSPSTWDVSCNMWDLVPQPELNLCPAFRALSPNHWTTREVTFIPILETER